MGLWGVLGVIFGGPPPFRGYPLKKFNFFGQIFSQRIDRKSQKISATLAWPFGRDKCSKKCGSIWLPPCLKGLILVCFCLEVFIYFLVFFVGVNIVLNWINKALYFQVSFTKYNDVISNKNCNTGCGSLYKLTFKSSLK